MWVALAAIPPGVIRMLTGKADLDLEPGLFLVGGTSRRCNVPMCLALARPHKKGVVTKNIADLAA